MLCLLSDSLESAGSTSNTHFQGRQRIKSIIASKTKAVAGLKDEAESDSAWSGA